MQEEWQKLSLIIKDALGLQLRPVAVSCLKEPGVDSEAEKIRICRAILDASQGASLKVSKGNNACFGAAWHLGFVRLDNPHVEKMIKKFVVEGEKLFCSYEALDNLVSQMEEAPDNSGSYFALAPMDEAEVKPGLVIFVCNPEEACRLLTLVTFIDGNMPGIKIGGPTCRMAIIYPMLTGEVNISFYDSTARKMCNVDKDKLLVSIPYKRIPGIADSIDKCSAGTAKIEYPQEFREFLKKAMVK